MVSRKIRVLNGYVLRLDKQWCCSLWRLLKNFANGNKVALVCGNHVKPRFNGILWEVNRRNDETHSKRPELLDLSNLIILGKLLIENDIGI